MNFRRSGISGVDRKSVHVVLAPLRALWIKSVRFIFGSRCREIGGFDGATRVYVGLENGRKWKLFYIFSMLKEAVTSLDESHTDKITITYADAIPGDALTKYFVYIAKGAK